jgi:GTPase SAR1 family protein
MVGLDAAGKTTILYKLKLGEIVTTIPTIGKASPSDFRHLCNSRVLQQQPPSSLGQNCCEITLLNVLNTIGQGAFIKLVGQESLIMIWI